jgi:hypothetical protein
MTLATQRRDYLASTSLTPPGQIPLVRSLDDEVRADRIDRASAAANAYGLVNDYGDDAVQAIFSEAFVEVTVTPNTIDVQKDEIASSNDADLIIPRLSDVAIEPIEQLWQNRFYVGKQSLLIGEQGIGKSQLTCFMAAAVSNGSAWSCDEGQAPLGSVIFLSAEDNAADTIDQELNFAKPALRVKDRRYWLEADLIAWEASCVPRGDTPNVKRKGVPAHGGGDA